MRNYEPNADRVVALYQQLEDDIITAMIRRMMRMGKVSDTTKYQAEILQQAGLLYTDIVQIITNRTDACSAAVKALFEDAGVETVSIENDIHETAEQLPVNIRQSSPMRRVLEAGYRKTQKTLRNLVGTTANTTQQAFYDACDRSYMQVSSGAFSYQEAIRTAVRSLADTGAYVTYPTGHRDRIDVAVRRCTLTGVGQTSAAVSKTYAEETGCHLMELTAHSGARPEHARWQGQLVTLTGEDAGETIDGLHVYTLHEIGYGSGEGFKGWNCRHDWHAYYKGISKPNYTLEQIKKLNEKNISYNGKKYTKYEISQVRRQGERNVRALKRRTLASQAAVENAPDEETKAVLQADYAANAAKLKESEKQLKTFCSQTGQRRDTFREQVDGFGRSAAQKAVHAAAEKKRLTIDWDSGKIDTEVFRKSLQKGYVKTKVEKNKQIKHTYNKQWKNQVKQAVQSFSNPDPKKRQTPRSVLRKDIDPQEIVSKYGGTGRLSLSDDGKTMNEYIELPEVIGKTFDKKIGRYVDTKTVQIKYSKGGTHVIPTIRKSAKKEGK